MKINDHELHAMGGNNGFYIELSRENSTSAGVKLNTPAVTREEAFRRAAVALELLAAVCRHEAEKK